MNITFFTLSLFFFFSLSPFERYKGIFVFCNARLEIGKLKAGQNFKFSYRPHTPTQQHTRTLLSSWGFQIAIAKNKERLFSFFRLPSPFFFYKALLRNVPTFLKWKQLGFSNSPMSCQAATVIKFPETNKRQICAER